LIIIYMEYPQEKRKPGRPSGPPENRRVKLGPKVKPSTAAEIRRRAEAENKSVGDIIDEAIERTKGE
jgi:hypothetical protein